ncbi:hypothetical protein, partial [Acinetobacter sp. UBA6526]|uniref:hypothetical protein n=1 Tax=Acinetobacter sp. UBA6526 TaxID=1945950 RepID=UPI00257DA529
MRIWFLFLSLILVPLGLEAEEYNGSKVLYSTGELCETNVDSANCNTELIGSLNTNFGQLPVNPIPPFFKNPNPGGGVGTLANIDCGQGGTDKAYLGCYNNVSSYGVAIGVGNSVTSYSISMGINTSADGSHAVALGNEADANAIYDVSVGASAGQNASNTGSNVYVGYAAGQSSDGSNNTAIGRGAGQSSTGSNNVFIGYDAGNGITGSDQLYISSNSSNLITGDFSTGQLDLGQTSGTVTALNDFNVDGDASFDGTATVTGATTLSSTLGVSGAT